MRWFESKYKSVKVPYWVVRVICRRAGTLRFEWKDEKKMREFIELITKENGVFFTYGNGSIRQNDIYKIETIKEYTIKRVKKKSKEETKNGGQRKA